MKQHSIIKDIILTVITFGLWNIYVQWRQIQDLNELYEESGKYSFIFFIILCVITLGFYLPIHEYRMSVDINLKIYKEPKRLEAFLLGIASFFGFWVIVDSFQQSLLNSISAKSSKG